MPISIQCPQCGKTYKLRDDLAGKRAKCKFGQTLVVPEAAPAPEPAADLAAVPASDPLSDLLDEALTPVAGGMPLDGLDDGAAAAAPLQPVLPRTRPSAKAGGRNPVLIAAIVAGSVVGVLLIGLVILLVTRPGDASATGEEQAASHPRARRPPLPPPKKRLKPTRRR